MFIDSLAYFTILYDLLHLLNNQCRYCTNEILSISLQHQIIRSQIKTTL